MWDLPNYLLAATSLREVCHFSQRRGGQYHIPDHTLVNRRSLTSSQARKHSTAQISPGAMAPSLHLP